MTTTPTAPVVSEPRSTPPPPPPSPRRVPGWLIAALVIAPVLLILFIMSGSIIPGSPGTSPLRFLIRGGGAFQFPELLVANTPTGGDMGAHVMLPQILRDSLIPSGRLLGWSDAWYAGFPMMYFYFPLPAIGTILLDIALPYGVAFKLVTVAGLMALPVATYFFVRWFGFSQMVSAVAAVSGGLFVFMESYSIFGANIKSTLAGEFSFSWSFALSLLYLGLVTRNTREDRPWSPWAGILLALTALSHIVTTIVVVFVSIPLLFRRGGPKHVLSSWALGFAISAFWALPLAVRVLEGMTTDMGWSPVRNVIGDAIPGSPLPGELAPMLVLGMVGMAWTLLRRDDVAVLVAMTVLPLLGYFALPLTGRTELYNARLLPYWYFGLFVFAGLALGLAVVEFARRLPQRKQNVVLGSSLVALILFNATALAIHDVPGWVKWNFEGIEGKETYAEYRSLIETIDELPPGRVMWEYNRDHNKYGTPMALMLIPYFSEGHTSMEGLLFESSLTTPFHFLIQSEASESPSRPVRGLPYRGLDIDRAVSHMELFDVQYYVTYTDAAREAAEAEGLVAIAQSPPFVVFGLPSTSAVEVATFETSVYAGELPFLEASVEWWDDVEMMDRWLAESGPESWPRVVEVSERAEVAQPLGATGSVSDVLIDGHRISFSTSAVGVPHMVKVSYFTNWVARGADGPYRASPSTMIVVPTQENVVIEFESGFVENLGLLLTLVALVLLVVAFLLRRSRKKKELRATSPPPG